MALGIAAAILAAAGAVPAARLDGMVLYGELGLDGRIRAVPGVLPAAAAAAAAGFGAVAVAVENAQEAALVPELSVLAAPCLAALTAWLRSGAASGPGITTLGPTAATGSGARRAGGATRPAAPGGRAQSGPAGYGAASGPAGYGAASGPAGGCATSGSDPAAADGGRIGPDLADLVGQPMARRAAEICAAGGHNLLLIGPPGVGKPTLPL